MRRRTLVLVVHLVVAALITSSIVIYLLVRSGQNDDGVHEPLLIVADDYFTSGNGVSSGAGTEADPFVIKDLVIEVPSDPVLMGQGIRISHTDAHFVIRNVTIRSDGPGWVAPSSYPVGIFLNAAENAVIESCTIQNMSVGIEIAMSSDAVIRDSTMVGCGVGIHSELSTSTGYLYGLTVAGNTFTRDTVGVHIYYSPWDIHVTDNVYLDNGVPTLIEGCRVVDFSGNSVSGTEMTVGGLSEGPVFNYCHDLNVTSNVVTGVEGDGLEIDGSLRVVVSDNSIGCDGRCLVVSDSTDVDVAGNVILSGQAGVWIQSSDEVEVTMNRILGVHISFALLSPGGETGVVSVYHNHVEVLAVPLVDDGVLEAAWDDGYPSGGNFWDGNTGSYAPEDLDGDGVSEEPFYLDADSADEYPLMSSPL
jgi:parallel beta-helix repeat protein